MQHPEITWIENTGYPSWYRNHQIICEWCDRDITDQDVYEDENYKCLCERCILRLHRKEC